MASAEVVLFAIQGALKLGTQMRAAYVDSTRRRDLILPLPDFKPGNNPLGAISYFKQQTVTEPEGLRLLVVKIKHNDDLNETEQAALVLYHNEMVLKNIQGGAGYTVASDGSAVAQQSLDALVSVRQWQRDPNPSALQRIAGTLVDLGVDYFATGPGAQKLTSAHASALKAYLEGLDQIDFATESLADLPPKLFIVTLDTVAQHPEAFSGNSNTQAIVQAATRGLLVDVNDRITVLRKAEGSNDLKESGIRSWGEIVFRSLLSSTATLLVDDPERFLGVKSSARAAMITSVGNATLSLVLSKPPGALDEVLTREGLASITQAALGVTAEYPELLTKDARLSGLLSQIAGSIGPLTLSSGTSLMPEVARLVLDKTAENLPLLWPDATAPNKHLGLVAAQTTLSILARKSKAGDMWQGELRKQDLLAIVASVLDDVVRSPGWLLESDGKVSPQLGTALEAMLAVLRQRGDARMSSALATQLLQSGLTAAASRSEFLSSVPAGGVMVSAILDTVLRATMISGADRKVTWATARESVIIAWADAAFAKLATSKLDAGALTILKAAADAQIQKLQTSQAWQTTDFADDLAKRLLAA